MASLCRGELAIASCGTKIQCGRFEGRQHGRLYTNFKGMTNLAAATRFRTGGMRSLVLSSGNEYLLQEFTFNLGIHLPHNLGPVPGAKKRIFVRFETRQIKNKPTCSSVPKRSAYWPVQKTSKTRDTCNGDGTLGSRVIADKRQCL